MVDNFLLYCIISHYSHMQTENKWLISIIFGVRPFYSAIETMYIRCEFGILSNICLCLLSLISALLILVDIEYRYLTLLSQIYLYLYRFTCVISQCLISKIESNWGMQMDSNLSWGILLRIWICHKLICWIVVKVKIQIETLSIKSSHTDRHCIWIDANIHRHARTHHRDKNQIHFIY